MKTGTVPFPREFTVGAVGIDCRAVKRALAVALGGPQGMSLKTNVFAKTAGAALATFKQRHGLLHDPVYTVEAHRALQPSFDEYGASLMVKKTASIAAQNQRDAFCDTLRWFIAHPGVLAYAEVRPIPENLTPFETSQKIVTDCTGSIEVAAKWSGVPDPSRYGFNGQGNTGSFLNACVHIQQKQALPGDLIVWRKGSWDTYGHHGAGVILETNPLSLFSFGYVGDPCAHSFTEVSADQARFGATTATFLRFLPVP